MNDSGFSLDYEPQNDTYIIRALQPVVADRCEELRRILEMVASNRPRGAVLDLQDIRVMTRAAFALLLDFAPRLEREQLRIRCSDPGLVAALRFCYLDTLYHLEGPGYHLERPEHD